MGRKLTDNERKITDEKRKEYHARSERKARKDIDKMLSTSGWILQDYKDLNLGAGLGIADNLETALDSVNELIVSLKKN